MTLQVSPKGKAFADRIVRRHNLQEGFLICVPPARWASKCYPVRHWRAVATKLAVHAPVVLIGTAGERDLCQAVADGLAPGVLNLAGHTEVSEMVGLIATSSGVVCGDSAAQFIALAVGTGVVTLIGPTRVERTGPVLAGHARLGIGARAPGGAAIVADVPCQGCLKRRCRHITCMESIRPAQVVSAVEEILLKRSH